MKKTYFRKSTLRGILEQLPWIACTLILILLLYISRLSDSYLPESLPVPPTEEEEVVMNDLPLNENAIDNKPSNLVNVPQSETFVNHKNERYNIVLQNNLPVGTYTLFYEDNNGILKEYSQICSLEITDTKEDTVYNGFITENCSPYNATNIGIYNSLNIKVGDIPLNSLKLTNLGEKLYSFAAVSDTHIGAQTAESDFINALTYFENYPEIEFIAIAGDLSLSGTDENLSKYKSIIDSYTTKPVYAITGNHEAARGYLTLENMLPYTNQNLYYSFEKGNDVYIMVGMYDIHEGNQFSNEELQWLYEVLEQNKNKRCFLFMHLFPGYGSGDAMDLDIEGDMLDNAKGTAFYSLLSHYNNVIFFHGHSHQNFEMQNIHEMNTYDKIFGCHSVHIPSLAYPRKYNENSLDTDYNGSQGYIVDVYENSIVLRGRDFVTEKFLPIATYRLDTTIKDIEANTYYDITGTIINSNSNILKPGASWYEGSVDKSTITKISFKDSYSGSYTECWDASVSKNNQVTVYRNGNELTVVGNKDGVVANSDSRGLFKDFTNLKEIEGLEKLNTSNITMASEMFYNCSSVENLNLSVWNLSNAFGSKNGLTNMFGKCTNLINAVLPDNICSDYSAQILLTGMFFECEKIADIDLSCFSEKQIDIRSFAQKCRSLKNITFGASDVSNMLYAFDGCSAIEKIDMSNIKSLIPNEMQYAFRNCSSLTQLILPNTLDTTSVKDMRGLFENCSLLSLDCSSWYITKQTNTADFNKNAPFVKAPAIE